MGYQRQVFKMGKWNDNRYVIKEKKLTIGRQYYILDGSEKLIGYCIQKLFKLKEDVRVYTGEDKKNEMFRMKQEQILNFLASFEIKDLSTGKVMGYTKREFPLSLFRDTWSILDNNRNVVCIVSEEGTFAIFRRIFSFLRLFPKTYHFRSGTKEVAILVQKFQIIGDTWTLDIDPQNDIDTKLLVSASLLMDIIEQQSKR
jgi:uncharacterized protein YxjI